MLENVRCFSGPHHIKIKPLTLLIGENSAGKSTLLATLATMSDPLGFPMQPKFNEPPYNLGSYDTIATYKGGKFGRAKSFSLGYKDIDNPKGFREITATYKNLHGQVQISNIVAKGDLGQVTLTIDDSDAKKGTLSYVIGKNKEKSLPVSFTGIRDIIPVNNLQFLLYTIFSSNKNPTSSEYSSIVQIISGILESMPSTYSIAPVRTKPKRTYDQAIEGFNPEGDDIPFLLARLLNEHGNIKQKNKLLLALQNYGEESGLFKSISVKQLGKQISDPFQVLVQVAGKHANLLDVGYGISQTLPVIIHSVLLAKEHLLLLQQPEVHLHPKAQAALGSFFVDLVIDGQKKFVIETHSDYIVDRVRQAVAKNKIKQSEVGLIFFERNGLDTIIHPLDLDNSGNIINAPPCYREFFLQEELNLLSRTL